MQRRTIKDEATRHSLTTMLERIEALSTVHRRLYQSKDVSRFDVSDFAKDLVTDLLTASGRSEIKSNAGPRTHRHFSREGHACRPDGQ